MSRLAVVFLLAAGALVASAQTVNWIYQHNSAYWLDPNDPNSGDPNYYEIAQVQHRILIHKSKPNQTFWFEAALLYNGQYSGPGNIDLIAADPNAGTVEVKIVGNGHDYGAATVDAVSLGGLEDAECTLTDLTTSGDIGADGEIHVDRATGDWYVGEYGLADILSDVYVGCFLGFLYCNTLEDLYIGNECAGQGDWPPPYIQVWGETSGKIESQMTNVRFAYLSIDDLLTGNIDIHGNINFLGIKAMDTPATVRVRGDLASMHVNHGPFPGSSITVDGSITNHISVGTNPFQGETIGDVLVGGDCAELSTYTPLAGAIEIGGDATYTSLDAGGSGTLQVVGTVDTVQIGGAFMPAVGLAGTVDVGGLGSLEVYYGDLSGVVIVHTDFDGSIAVGADGDPYDLTGTLDFEQDVDGAVIEVWGDLGQTNDAGQIKIDGSFGKYTQSSLKVHGSLVNSGSFVTVDYDATGDPWGEYGGMCIGDPNDPNDWYYENTPAMRLYAITQCKADVDNDEEVDSDDLYIFLDYLENPAGYGQQYPGLLGSLLFHADLNCDDVVDEDDIDPFEKRVEEGCCSPYCGDCPEGGDGLSAQQLAAGLRTHFAGERRAWLRDLVSDVADRLSGDRRTFWLAVRQHLGE